MLNAHLNRSPIARSARIAAVIALLLITVPIAGFGAFAQTPSATFSGSVMDQIGRILPEITLVLSNVQTQAKYDLRSDQTGHFEVVGLPAGDYQLGAQIPGFAYQQGKFTLGAGQNLHRDIALQVGSVQETITVTATTDSGRVERPRVTERVTATSQPEFDRCSQSPVGGCLAQPTKIRDVKPRYPQSLRDIGTDGQVTLEGRIGTDGFIKDLRILGTADPDLASAAAEAVGQWQFTPTRLDGVPIEVSVKVSVTFVR